jgi:repressor LexA
MTSLTPRQRAAIDYIYSRVKERKPPPTVREIGATLGIGSTNGVTCHLNALVRKGWIEVDRCAGRGLRLTRAAKKALSGFPLVELADLNR